MKIKVVGRPLRPHQVEGFERFKDQDWFPIIMEMRLGKSLLAIRWCLHRLASLGITEPRILLVAPTTPLAGWMEELEREAQPYHLLRGSPKSRREYLGRRDAGARWLLVHYGQVANDIEGLIDHRFDAVILDESTRIKNPQAQVTKHLFRYLCESIKVRAVLTGLPNPQSQFELWTQMAWCYGGEWMECDSFWKWRDRVGYLAGFSWEVKEEWRPKIKRQFHDDAYVLTRQQAGLGSIKIPTRRVGDLPGSVRPIYKAAVRDWCIPGLDGEEEAKHNVVVCAWLRRICGGFLPEKRIDSWKYQEVVDLLQGELRGQQAVIWFAFNSELHRLVSELHRVGIRATGVTGAMPLTERRRAGDRFRAGDIQIFCCQIACGRYGLDLSCADVAIYFSNSYSYEDRRQSEDRIVSAVKTTPLLVLDLVTRNTADEDVIQGLKDKRENASYYINRIMSVRRTG